MKKLRRSKVKSQRNAPLTPWEKAQQEHRQKLKHEKHHFFKKDRIGNKLPSLVRQRRKILRRRLIVNLVIFAALGIAASYLILPISKVQEIKVTGVDKLTEEAIVSAGEIRKDNLVLGVLLNEKKIKARVSKKVSEVKSVRLMIEGTTVNYRVKEYPIVGYVAKEGKYYSLNDSGKVSKISRDQAQGAYPLYYKFNNHQKLEALARQVNRLSPNLRSAISEIHYTPTNVNDEKIRVYMNDGNEVIASISTFAKKMVYYPDIKGKANNKILIDFEVGAYSYPLK